MKKTVALAVSILSVQFFSLSTFAQAISDRIASESKGTCLILQNPHSYGCNDWTFHGNNVFPLLPLDWMGRVQGNWSMVTYADNVGDHNSGPEFIMLKARGRNTIPAGVFDLTSRKVVGNVTINGSVMTFHNWQGTQMSTTTQSFNRLDHLTIQLQAISADKKVHLFTCRNFDRSNTPHLICRWESRPRSSSNWQHKGYLGFLRTGN